MKGKAFPVLIGAGVSIILIKSGFLFLFFLVPLGFITYKYGREAGWAGLLAAILGNALILAISTSIKVWPFINARWDFVFFLIMAPVFMLIIAPPEVFPKIPGPARFVAGSVVSAFLITLMFFWIMASQDFLESIDSWIKAIASHDNPDLIRYAFLEGISAETIVLMMQGIMLRGGSLVTCVFIFFVCHQICYTMSNVIMLKKTGGIDKKRANYLVRFHVRPQAIWFFSASLFLVVLSRVLKLEKPEIILWNILILYAMLYLAQGLGILQFFLTRPSVYVFPKFLLVILFFVLLSPVINALLFGALMLLGIAENWVPFRAPKKNGSPSTPKAGNGGS